MRRSSRILLWSLLAAFVLIVVAAISLLTVPPPLESWLQGKVVEALREHYHRDVQLQNLKVTLIPQFEASADNFVLPNFDPKLPPFITAKHFEVRAGLPELLRRPLRLGYLKFDNLVIHVPPKGSSKPPQTTQPRKTKRISDFAIGKVDADGTLLFVLRKDPTDEPMLFDICKLTLHSAGIGQPMRFQANLTNPTPPGIVQSTGSFGPWNFNEPSDTKVNGHYIFSKADLSVFNGISGTLSSTGDYSGELNNIVVDGTTDTPDFQLDRGTTEVHLTTRFHAVVDGTNGNTYLQPVEAHFLDSTVVCNGEVAGKKGEKGKTIAMDVDVPNSHVEDLLQLASKHEPAALTGQIDFKGHVTVPPGSDRVLRKLLLNGNFRVQNARFHDIKFRQAVTELSRRGQGKPHDESIKDVPAQFAGNFRMARTQITFDPLQFSVIGASAQLKGSYGIKNEKLAFVGDIKLKATMSQAVGGMKQWILVPLDPIFMKHAAGTYVPFHIEGTRDDPQIKVDWKKLF